MKFAKIVFALVGYGYAFVADAAKVGKEGFTVPPFSCFGTTAKAKWEMTAAESDLSGATYDPESGNIFVVNNGDRKVYEVSNGGSGYIWNILVNTFDVSSKTKDLEGISALGSRQFAITDENPASIIKITLASNGSVTGDVTFGTGGRPHTGTAVLSSGIPAAGANLGFEGTTKIGNDYYAIQEQDPTKLWKLTGGKSPIAAYSGDLKDSKDYEITSVGGMTRGGDATDEVFLVTKAYVASGRDPKTRYKQAGILRYQLSTRTVIERFGGEVCKMAQPEGLTFWKEGPKVMMLVVGETTQARIYEADAACTDSIGDISTLMATCKEKVKLTADCEKTKADGGCGWRRCDKSTTPHTKICTHNSKCTEADCLAHCANSSFAVADAVKGRCTHWAYDIKESECYIFSGCNKAAWDQDYTLYAMQDPTCERTRDEYPLGCEHRRCDKSQSTHNKICTDDSAETQCTLAECEKKCRDHIVFTCSTYAYDVKEKECYIFETCVNEQFEQDYSTYVLTDPTCDRQRDSKDSPGCTQRICDEDATTHEHVCTRESQQCSKDECELLCAAKVFEDVGAEAFCNHWAYDTAHKECYLFHGCTGEKFSDDFDLFFQTYGERVALRKTDSYLKLRDPGAGTGSTAVPSTTAQGLSSRMPTAVVPDELRGKNSTEVKLSLDPAIFVGRTLEEAATFVLNSVVSPALKKLRVPVGTYTRFDDDESPVLVQFFDSACWQMRDAHNILRLRSYKYVESGDPKRKADFSYKHRVASAADMFHHNMDTSLLTGNLDSRCGRHDYKRELMYPNKILWQTYRSFRTDGCTNKLLAMIDGNRLATARQWGAAFPGLGIDSNDNTPVSVYKETWQSKFYIGGSENSKTHVFLCRVQRGANGDCPHGNLLKTKMTVEAWYDSRNVSDTDSFVAAELTWDSEDALDTANNYDSDALFRLLRRDYGHFFGNGTKTSALFGEKPRSCKGPTHPTIRPDIITASRNNSVVVVSGDAPEISKLQLYGILGVCTGSGLILVIIVFFAIFCCYRAKKNKTDALLREE